MAQLIPSTPLISEQERVNRAEHLRYVLATQRLEGIELEPEVVRVFELYINGEISLAEVSQQVDKLPL